MRLSGVGYRYGWRAPWVLTRVDLDLRPGGLVRVGGYNGCGKSTLLRIIAGAHRPGRGTVTGRPGGVAYVPGQLPPLPFKAQDYLRHCGRLHGLSAAESDERMLDWLERFEALGYRKHRIGDLSRGTAQKVAIIQALIAQPQLLILDEAWTSLDSLGQQTLDEAVRDSVQRGGRVVFADHDPQRLAEDATLYLLRDGTLHEARAGDFELPLVLIDLEDAPDPWPGPGRGRLLADDLLRIEVEPDGSDRLLREILSAHPDIHVASVRTVDGRAAAPAVKQEAEGTRPAQRGTGTASPPAPDTVRAAVPKQARRQP
ncbi:ABC transporter ATP-binding protein [Actinocrinis puniceicyclus]|uniref:ABC transporter ATP-binding protein n=1 Tax=Actinocrinis puniceicyclus TaxID=977794 RepID=A0A8J8BG99_9ACTN|nr:ABC transporter ATP-binding protein [Actinocrinis puniceicyclus]MBS2966921.1 ABC transporter ATP-binding protein [Actinocrinis puniceicyclus]